MGRNSIDSILRAGKTPENPAQQTGFPIARGIAERKQAAQDAAIAARAAAPNPRGDGAPGSYPVAAAMQKRREAQQRGENPPPAPQPKVKRATDDLPNQVNLRSLYDSINGFFSKQKLKELDRDADTGMPRQRRQAWLERACVHAMQDGGITEEFVDENPLVEIDHKGKVRTLTNGIPGPVHGSLNAKNVPLHPERKPVGEARHLQRPPEPESEPQPPPEEIPS